MLTENREHIWNHRVIPSHRGEGLSLNQSKLSSQDFPLPSAYCCWPSVEVRLKWIQFSQSEWSGGLIVRTPDWSRTTATSKTSVQSDHISDRGHQNTGRAKVSLRKTESKEMIQAQLQSFEACVEQECKMSPEHCINNKCFIFSYLRCLAPVMSFGSTCLELEVKNRDYETHDTWSSPLTELRNKIIILLKLI